MNWKKKCLHEFNLYAITDLKCEDPDLIPQIEAAIRGGVDIVQLRSKRLTDCELIRIGKKIRAVTAQFEKLLFLNDRVDLMMAVDADGVHLGQDDLPVDVARRIMGSSEKMIGKSTHSVEQAVATAREDVDYIGFGPLFQTPTKPHYKPVGLNRIKEVQERVHVPVVCIGGINGSNAEEVIRKGAQRIAVVRAIFSASDSYQAAMNLKGVLTSCLNFH